MVEVEGEGRRRLFELFAGSYFPPFVVGPIFGYGARIGGLTSPPLFCNCINAASVFEFEGLSNELSTSGASSYCESMAAGGGAVRTGSR